MNLTVKIVSALTALPAGKGDHIEWDDELKGFGLRLRLGAGGQVKRNWIAQYRVSGATRRMLLGSAVVLNADEARKAAKKVLARVALGEDPAADRADRRDKDQLTVSDAVKEYLLDKKSKVRARTLVEVTRYLTGRYFRPLLSKPLDQVSRKDVAARLMVIARESGSVTAVRARAAAGAFFSWSMTMGLIENNPVIGSYQPKASSGRSRVLVEDKERGRPDELGAIWRACGDDHYGKIVKLLILSGCRRQEVGGMAFSELNREKGTWIIPEARTKNGHEHTLPLPPAAWKIIDAVPEMATRDQLFGVHSEKGFAEWGDGKLKLDKRLGDGVAPWVLHEIRRSVATGMANLGVQPHVVEAILNHQSGHKAGVAGVYNKSSYQPEMKAALAMWADYVRSLVEASERKVLQFVPNTAS